MGLGGEKPQALLAILLLHHDEVVSADRLIDDLWGESPPETALRTLQAYVSRLRKALDANGAAQSEEPESRATANGGVLLTRGRGYLLEVAPGGLDLERFRDLAERGRDALAAGNPDEGATVLREALGIWRGPPLPEFAYEPFAQPVIAQLEELHLAAVEDRVEADLALGRARELVIQLRDLVARHPLRERLRGQLMLALYRSGRQAEALEAYQAFRRSLSEELGLEPGPAIQRLELSILNREPALSLAATDAAADAGGEVPAAAASRLVAIRRHRLTLAVGAAVLLALMMAAVVMAVRGGRTTPPATIPGDAVGAISPTGGAVRAVVPLGTSPSSLAAGGGAVWVANYNQGTVSRIDPGLRTVVDTLQVGSTPTGLAVGAGAVWVTDNYGATVLRIDPAVNRVVQSIPVGNAPTGVVVGEGSVWVGNYSDGTLSRIDATTGHVIKTIALGGRPTDVAVGLGDVWVSDQANDRVLRFDPQGNQVIASIHVGTGPTAITVGFGSVWVTNSLDGTVSRIDPTTNAVDATIAAGNGAGSLATGKGAVWVADQYAGTVSEISPTSNTCCELAVKLDPDVRDLRNPKASELRARLVHGEPGRLVGVVQDDSVQGRVQHRPRVIPEHALGDRVVAHKIADAVGVVPGKRHHRVHVAAEVDEESVWRRGVDELDHLRPCDSARHEIRYGCVRVVWQPRPRSAPETFRTPGIGNVRRVTSYRTGSGVTTVCSAVPLAAYLDGCAHGAGMVNSPSIRARSSSASRVWKPLLQRGRDQPLGVGGAHLLGEEIGVATKILDGRERDRVDSVLDRPRGRRPETSRSDARASERSPQARRRAALG